MKDMRSFLEALSNVHPEQILEISEKISLEYEVTAIQMELMRAGKAPVLIFKNIKGSNLPLVTNLYGDRSRLSFGLNPQPNNLILEFLQREKHRIEPVIADEVPVQEVIYKHNEVNLFSLPVVKAYESDAAPYITAGIAISKDPLTGIRNASYSRLMIAGKDTAYTRLGPGRHLRHHFVRAEERDNPLYLTFSIGIHPACALGTLASIPIDEDEIEVMGGIAKEPIRLARALTIEGECLADSEIVLEGYLVPGERMEEGPCCEFTGYSTGMRKRNVFKVTAITRRKDALYHHLASGSPEHLMIGAVPREAKLFVTAQNVLPTVKAVHVPESGCGRFHCYVSMKKIFQGQPKTLAMALLGADFYLKHIVVLDEDVDVYDERQVLWAIATRVQANRDICIIPEALGAELDPSSAIGNVGSKLIIDATAKPTLKEYSPRATIPEHIINKIKRMGILDRKDGVSP
jgi:UbiD family decarboxylase